MTKTMQDLSTAPKDGTIIIIVYKTPGADFLPLAVRIAWYTKPKTLEAWEAGDRPRWEYISDEGYSRQIKEINIIGWWPVPEGYGSVIK